MDISQLLAFSVKNGASDLHLSAGVPPMIRVDGDVRRINVPVMEHKQVHSMVYDIMNDKQRKDYEEFLEIDFSFEIPGLARFRVNAFNQSRGAGAVFRTIPTNILTLEELDCPRIFTDISTYPRGLVLVTGPTGSGKSTTLAAMINQLLRAVISQTLCRKIGGGRIAAHEIMLGTPAIRNLIREDKVAQMYSSIQTSQNAGMQTLDQCLKEIQTKGLISKEEARRRAANKDDF